MIDWNTIEINQELSLRIIEDNKCYSVKAVLIEYEWALNRKPHIADIKIIESDNTRFNKGDVLRLPIITNNDEEEHYLVHHPINLSPNNHIRINAKIIID